jgi:hypothetical protein
MAASDKSPTRETKFSIAIAEYLAAVSPAALTELAQSLGERLEAKALKSILDANLLEITGTGEDLVDAVLKLIATGDKFNQDVAREWVRRCVEEAPECAGSALITMTQRSSHSPDRVADNSPDVLLEAGADPMLPSLGCPLHVTQASVYFDRAAPIASMLGTIDNLKVEQLQRKGLLPLCKDRIPVVGENTSGVENYWYRRSINLVEYALICGHPTAIDRAMLLLDTTSPAIRRDLVDSLGNFLEGTRVYEKIPSPENLLKICDIINAGADFEHRPDLVVRRFCEGKSLPLIICDGFKAGSEIEVELRNALHRLLESPRADVNVTDGYGNSMLGYAVGRQDRKLVEFLLEKGADMNLADERGETPLMKAKTQKDPELLQMLLAWRAQTAVKGTIDKVLKSARSVSP